MATIPPMTLARTWGRQLCAASSVALIVPTAMVAALVVLALGGGFSGLGVLGQIFAGPSIPNAGPLIAGGSGAHATTRSAGNPLPVIPVARFVADGTAPRAGGAGRGVPPPRTGVTRTGVSSTGGAVGQGGVTTRPVTQRPAPGPASPHPPGGAAPGPTPSTPSPSPAPSPHPTPADTVARTVTSVTSQLPAPAGPAVTQAVQSAGSAADGLLP